MSKLLIQFSHLYKSFGPLQLFEDISLSINKREALALVGENGAGKTTLLQLLLGTVQEDKGIFTRDPYLSIGFLSQEISVQTGILAKDYIEEGLLQELERQMSACLEQADRLAEWESLHEKYEQLGGYRRMPLEKILNGLKLNLSILDLPMQTLSSGQRVRIALAKAMIENPDLLLLDEPTNHLDQGMQEWLMEALSQREGATVIVSHDRQFLNKTCNVLIEIKKGKLVRYGGSYNFYLEEQERLLQRQIKAYEAQEEARKMLRQKIKAITFSKAKPAPSSDRNVMAYDKRGEHHQKSLQRSLDSLKAQLAELEAEPLPHPRPKSIKGLRFIPEPLASSVAIELEGISKAFGEMRLFSGVSKLLCKGDRIVLTGANGSGKTTLMKCIAGLIPVDAGHIRYASSTKIAYLDQEVELLPMEKTPLEYFEMRFNLSGEDLRSELHKAAIGGAELLERPFSTLSTGQRKRFMLLSLILEKPNVLLLDEPTNHLDFMTLEAFEKALLDFDGLLLAISHDAMFIEKIATEEWQWT